MKQLFDRIDRAKQNRNGGPRENRPEAVDSLLSDAYTVGFEQDEPVANVAYSDYPNDRGTVLRPEAGTVLNDIADTVESMEQLAEELGMSNGGLLDKAATLHGINHLPESVEPSPTVKVPDGNGGTIKIRKNEYDQFPNLFHLYVTLGMGSGEISQLVGEDERDVKRAIGRNNLL